MPSDEEFKSLNGQMDGHVWLTWAQIKDAKVSREDLNRIWEQKSMQASLSYKVPGEDTWHFTSDTNEIPDGSFVTLIPKAVDG